MNSEKTIAVVGSGIAGVSTAWHVDPSIKVFVLEQSSRLGGHTHTHTLQIEDKIVDVDSGFIVFNKTNYPNFIEWLKKLDVRWTKSNMSFSFSLDNGKFEWSGKNLGAVFAQKRNIISPGFYYMLYEINRFNNLAKKISINPDLIGNVNIKKFLSAENFDERFCKYYIFPMASAIWSTPENKILNFPALNLINFFNNHGLLNFSNHFDWFSILGGSKTYLNKFLDYSENRKENNIHILKNHKVETVRFLRDKNNLEKIKITGFDKKNSNGFELSVDGVVLSCHSNQSAKILRENEQNHTILDKIKYQKNTAVLHCDESQMPIRKRVWSAWNYISKSQENNESESLNVSYWMNSLQKLNTTKNIFVTLNASNRIDPKKIYKEMIYEHPLFTLESIDARSRLHDIQGKNNRWFAGAWLGYGFHEDGFVSGKKVAEMINDKFISDNE